MYKYSWYLLITKLNGSNVLNIAMQNDYFKYAYRAQSGRQSA